MPTEAVGRPRAQAHTYTANSADPVRFDRFMGYYQLGPTIFMHVFRERDHYFAELTGQPPVAWGPKGPQAFYSTRAHARITFTHGPRGEITGLVIHQHGRLLRAARVSAAVERRDEPPLQRRHAPSPGTRAKVLGYIGSLGKGTPLDYSSITPHLAALMRRHRHSLRALVRSAGAFRTLTFKTVAPNGSDVYVASFARGKIAWLIAPLTAHGRVASLKAVRVPVAVP